MRLGSFLLRRGWVLLIALMLSAGWASAQEEAVDAAEQAVTEGAEAIGDTLGGAIGAAEDTLGGALTPPVDTIEETPVEPPAQPAAKAPSAIVTFFRKGGNFMWPLLLLSIVGLAFEVTGDFRRDAQQVLAYAERHDVGYPLLVAGLSDKAAAGKAFPVLDQVRSYPTTIFLHADGRVRAIYQAFVE